MESHCVPITFSQSLLAESHLMHATHCLLWSNFDGVYYGIIQLRFDGSLGFPGGEVDEEITEKGILEATGRELKEEINFSGDEFQIEDWVCSHKAEERIVLHFFAKQITNEQFQTIEKYHAEACHFPQESLGLFRMPLGEKGKVTSSLARNFLKNFLRQKFAGNAKMQLMEAATQLELIGFEDILFIRNEITPDVEDAETTSGQSAICLLHSEHKIFYYEEDVMARYGLMVLRTDGLFELLHVSTNGQQITSTIESLNLHINEILNIEGVEVQANDLIGESADALTFAKLLSNEQLNEVLMKSSNAKKYVSEYLGVLLIPFSVHGTTEKSSDYCLRFFKGFSSQKCAKESKKYLLQLGEKLKLFHEQDLQFIHSLHSFD